MDCDFIGCRYIKKVIYTNKNLSMIKKILAIFLAALCCGLCVSCGPDDPDPYEMPEFDFSPKGNIVDDRQYYSGIDEVQFPNQLWNTPAFERAAQYDRQDQGVEAYFLQSVSYNDAPTYVFAYVGIPATATMVQATLAIKIMQSQQTNNSFTTL